jgi:hypothetical protein
LPITVANRLPICRNKVGNGYHLILNEWGGTGIPTDETVLAWTLLGDVEIYGTAFIERHGILERARAEE